MEKYSVKRFKSPCISFTNLDLHNKGVTINLPNGNFLIETGHKNNHQLYDHLQDLRNVESSQWRSSSDLIEALDKIGAIKDVVPPITSSFFWHELIPIQKEYDHILAYINDPSLLSTLIKKITVDSLHFVDTLDFNLTFTQQLLLTHLHYLKQFSPLAYHAVAYLMLANNAPYSNYRTKYHTEIHTLLLTNAYSSEESLHQISAFKCLLQDHISGNSGFSTPKFTPSTDLLTGNNIVLEAEAYISSALELSSGNSLASFIQSDDFTIQAAQQWYLSQYVVTKRYVSSITPILSRNINASLKNKLFRYYLEEIGHEKYEYENCRGLDLSKLEIEEYQPLAYHTLFIDLLTYIASVDTLAYILCLYLAEGLDDDTDTISELIYQSPVSYSKLHHLGNEHDTLNDDYQHRGLPRVLGSYIDIITPDQIQRSFGLLRLLLEVSMRAGSSIYQQMKSASHDCQS